MWNTYYARGLNSVVHLPDLASVRVGLYDQKQKFFLDNMLWNSPTEHSLEYRNVKRFGRHTEDGSYFEVELSYREFVFRLEFASDGEAFVLEVTPLQNPDPDLYFYISPLILWGKEGGVSVQANELTVTVPSQTYRIIAEGEHTPDVKIHTEALGAAFQASRPVRLLCNLSPEAGDTLMWETRQRAANASDRSGGWLRDASEAIWKALIWNTIYEPVKDRICVPVSRAWCTRNGKSFGSYVLFEWDTFFASLMGGVLSKQAAYQQVEAICGEVTKDGMIPNFGSQRGGSPDRSQPPVGSYCILKLYRQFGDLELLRRTFPLLLRWNRWWFQRRDGNGDGLLEWGSDPIPDGLAKGYFDEGCTMQAAMYESGLDNSPMYDSVPFNEKTHTMELNDVGLNALYALDCQSLAAIAELLGENGDAEALSGEYERMKRQMNDQMYDPETGMYCNTGWNGEKDYRFSPTNFYPLLAGISSPEQAEAMISRHLLNEEEFWGKYVIPSISKNSPAYKDQDYWRGRIWGPMNFLVYEGLRRSGHSKTAAAFAEKSFALFREEWEQESHIHENYNSITGDGDDKTNADPFYTWGALLAYLPVCQFVYVAPEGGVSFGCGHLPGALVRDFPLADARYTLDTREGFRLERNGKVFLLSTQPITVIGFQVRNQQAVLEVCSGAAAALTVFPQKDIRSVSVSIGGGSIWQGPLAEKLRLKIPQRGE